MVKVQIFRVSTAMLLTVMASTAAAQIPLELAHVRGTLPAGWNVAGHKAGGTSAAFTSPGKLVMVGLNVLIPAPPADDILKTRPGVIAAGAPLQYLRRLAGQAAVDAASVAYGYMTVAGRDVPAAFVSWQRPGTRELLHFAAFVVYTNKYVVYGMVGSEKLAVGSENGDPAYHEAIRQAYELFRNLRLQDSR